MLLTRQAGVVADDRAEGFRLSLGEKRVVVEGAQGAAEFRGHVPIQDYRSGAREEWLGVRPGRLGAVAGAVEAVGGDAYMSVSGPIQPLMLWGGEEVVVEALLMPVQLPSRGD